MPSTLPPLQIMHSPRSALLASPHLSSRPASPSRSDDGNLDASAVFERDVEFPSDHTFTATEAIDLATVPVLDEVADALASHDDLLLVQDHAWSTGSTILSDDDDPALMTPECSPSPPSGFPYGFQRSPQIPSDAFAAMGVSMKPRSPRNSITASPRSLSPARSLVSFPASITIGQDGLPVNASPGDDKREVRRLSFVSYKDIINAERTGGFEFSSPHSNSPGTGFAINPFEQQQQAYILNAGVNSSPSPKPRSPATFTR